MADDFWTTPLGGELRKAQRTQVLIESDDQEQARPCMYTVKKIVSTKAEYYENTERLMGKKNNCQDYVLKIYPRRKFYLR
jgi:hypothetical protein